MLKPPQAREIPMRVRKYIPQQNCGFASDGEVDLHFHLGIFHHGGGEFIPPIIGEEVSVLKTDSRVLRVCRTTKPAKQHGVVRRFNPKRGFGFIQTDAGEYYLHRSEVIGGKVPLKGERVEFYCSQQGDTPRACHVQVVR